MIKSRDIAEIYRRELEEGNMHTALVLHDLLVKSLSPQQQRVYQILKPLYPTTTNEIAFVIDRELNHVGNILSRLHDLKLVWRDPVIDDDGLYYKWYREEIP